MYKFLARWFINALAIYLAVYFVNGISLSGAWTSLIWIALIFGLINALLRPIIKLLTLPLIFITLGLFSLIINSFLFWLTSVIGQNFGLGLTVSSPIIWNAFLGGLVVSIVSVIMNLFIKDKRKKRR